MKTKARCIIAGTMLVITFTSFGQAPSITRQPQGQQVSAGANVRMYVVASGTAPLSYQWLLNGRILNAETNSSLVRNGVQVTDTASYGTANSVGRRLAALERAEACRGVLAYRP